jgi:hypothetical protein
MLYQLSSTCSVLPKKAISSHTSAPYRQKSDETIIMTPNPTDAYKQIDKLLFEEIFGFGYKLTVHFTLCPL